MIGVLDTLKGAGKINNKVVLLSVGDQFGAEFAAGFGAGLKGAGYDIVLQKSYPLGAADLTNEIKEAKSAGADTFIAGSYPPDTFMLAGTAITRGNGRGSRGHCNRDKGDPSQQAIHEFAPLRWPRRHRVLSFVASPAEGPGTRAITAPEYTFASSFRVGKTAGARQSIRTDRRPAYP